MSRRLDGATTSITKEFGFNWADCGAAASEDGTHIWEWTNTGSPVAFEAITVQNGTTAGTTTAATVTLSTANVDYLVTMPGGTSITALGYGYNYAFGEDVIDTDETVFATITGAPSAAKEAKAWVTFRSMA